MKTIAVYTDCPIAIYVHMRLDEISEMFPCIASYDSSTRLITIKCREVDAARIEFRIADLV